MVPSWRPIPVPVHVPQQQVQAEPAHEMQQLEQQEQPENNEQPAEQAAAE